MSKIFIQLNGEDNFNVLVALEEIAQINPHGEGVNVWLKFNPETPFYDTRSYKDFVEMMRKYAQIA